MSCATKKKNLGKSRCTQLPALPKCMITTPDNFKLLPADYADEAALKAALQTAIKAGIADRIYLWPLFSQVEPLSEEAQYMDTPLMLIPTRDGQYRYRFHISKNMALHKAMYTHRALNEGRVFIFDLDNQLFGTEDSDGNLQGFSLALLHTEKMKISDGATPSSSPIYVCLADNEEIDASGVLIDASVVNQLDRLTDVEIVLAGASAFAADEFTVDVRQSSDKDVPISGLVTADFIKYQADGVAVEGLAAVENPNVPGRYTLTATIAFTNGSLTLRAPSLLTVSAYECPEPLPVVIP